MGDDHIARPYTQSKKIQCLKQQMLLAQLQEARIQLSKDQLAILADTGERIDFGLGAFTLTTNAHFQADGVEVYDSDCDDVPNVQPSFMANISSYGSDVLAEVYNPDNMDNNIINQGVQAMPSFEQSSVVNHSETEITSDSNIIPNSQYMHETQQAAVQNSNSSAQQDFEPKIYDGNVIKNTSVIMIPDSEEILILAEESCLKMLLKQQDPEVIAKKVNTTPVDYNSMNSSESSPSSTPTKVDIPKELPKVSMVNTSLKKLKNHLAGFDMVVKERTTTTTITEGTWGFEHTKACFRDEIIPFGKALKDIFNKFDQYLIDELTEVQNVFIQMEQAIEQHRLE
ncbi:hypothetical protein Tco_0637787 [Tanacetum coccineum]